MTSWRQVGGDHCTFSSLVLPSHPHTPAVRCPSASKDSKDCQSYAVSAPDTSFTSFTRPRTKMGDQQAVAVDFHLRIWNTYSKSFPGRLSKSCYHPIHPNHLLPLAILICKELKLFPDSFSRSASRTMALLKELWVWPFWSQEPPSKASTPQRGSLLSALEKGCSRSPKSLVVSLTTAASSSFSFSSCPLDPSFCLVCQLLLNLCFYLFMLQQCKYGGKKKDKLVSQEDQL